jgi:pilus assembly protein CpaB
VGKTATLEVTPRQAEELQLARQLGTLSLALRSLVDAGSDSKADSVSNDKTGQRNSVNIVRFGVTTMTTPR